MLFKPHFKQDANDQSDNNGPQVGMEMEYSASADANMYANKENTVDNAHFQENVSDENSAMYHEAEVFCGMVVQQLTTSDSNDHKEEWHHGQLKAYNWAHDQLFDKK